VGHIKSIQFKTFNAKIITPVGNTTAYQYLKPIDKTQDETQDEIEGRLTLSFY
jgi:hypothetical protein